MTIWGNFLGNFGTDPLHFCALACTFSREGKIMFQAVIIGVIACLWKDLEGERATGIEPVSEAWEASDTHRMCLIL